MLEGELTYIKQAKRGNKEAFGLLYDHYMPAIYRFVFLKTNHKAHAEDLTHEVFLSAWQNIHRYRHQGHPFSSWLYQIAKNAIIDHYRTQKVSFQIEEVSEELVKADPNYHETLDQRIALERLKKAIHLLKPEYQDVLIMRFIEDMSFQEIAASLEKSEGAVRLTQHRALKELKSLFTPGEEESHGTPTLEA